MHIYTLVSISELEFLEILMMSQTIIIVSKLCVNLIH